MNKIIVASSAALLFATPSYAQSLSGARIEGRLGWDQIEIGLGYDDGSTRFSTEGRADDASYGAELGYDFAVRGTGILGAYAGAEFSGNKVCTPLYGEDEACISAGRNLAVGVRSGLRVGPHALAYLKGGYSNGKVEVSYRDYADPAYNLDVGKTRDGYHLGAGGEFAFAGNAYGKAEYVYTSYNGYAYDDGEVAAGIDSNRHQVVVGLGFRF